MEFVAGVIATLFIEFIVYKVLSKKYEIVKRPEPEAPTGSSGGYTKDPSRYERLK